MMNSVLFKEPTVTGHLLATIWWTTHKKHDMPIFFNPDTLKILYVYKRTLYSYSGLNYETYSLHK
jgi:hypothetical protein